MAKSVGVILAAAGQARRMGMGRNKAYLNLQGRPILAYSLQFFAAWPEVQEIVVVTAPDEIAQAEEVVALLTGGSKRIQVVAGGQERQDSVARGIAALANNLDLIAVHDAARPLVSAELFDRVLAAMVQAPGAIPVIPVTDTVKLGSASGLVERTIPREGLYQVQTPQVFTAVVLRECYARAQMEGFYGTDDASLLEHYGFMVQMVPGEKFNLKITTPFDLNLAEYWQLKLERGD
ncbi:MAG: 2-C-methyl-D-erythritol 4-phosphate cytidylyltransferase [Methylocystaceae bacterium]